MDFVVKPRRGTVARARGKQAIAALRGRLKVIVPLCLLVLAGLVVTSRYFAPEASLGMTVSPPSKSCINNVKSTKVLAVQKDNALASQWSSYANTGVGWTGGDSVHAYSLPSGSILWTFADSFLGPVRSNGSRPYSAPLVHNLFVTQNGGDFHLVVNGTPGHPMPLVVPPNQRNFYLALSGIVIGNQFQEFLMEIHRHRNGGFHWQQAATVIATFSLPGLHLQSMEPVNQPNRSIQWGSYVMRQGRYLYVYGATATAVKNKKMYVARTLSTTLAGPWEYFDGDGWTRNPHEVMGVVNGVSEQYSVTPLDGVYILITSSVGATFSSNVNVFAGCSPVGPFNLSSSFVASYNVGPLGQSLYHTSKSWVYEAMDQVALNKGAQFLVTYNRNSLDYWNLFDNVNLYRPGYLWVTIGVGFKRHVPVKTGAVVSPPTAQPAPSHLPIKAATG
ncbi:MAG: hypothetical protein M1399_06335 [Actinobacteria bacterium]|nr:hypothetical protein [Actinomycetota bacterium]MCL5446205.1 hypothetical protein [Actinomycetota bacterium]